MSILHEMLSDTANGIVSESRFAVADSDVTPPAIMTVPGERSFERELEYIQFLLDEPDTVFLRGQMRDRKQLKLTQTSFPGFKMLPIDSVRTYARGEEFWKTIHEKYGDGYYTVSLPILNAEGSKAYFRMAYYCGTYCGHGFNIICIKKDGRWVVHRIIGEWVV